MVLKSRVLAPDWSAGGNEERDAKCRHTPLPTKNDPDEFTDPFFYDEEEARHVCNGTYDGVLCPFREICLYRALVNNEQAGTFGGLTYEQRRWVRRHSRLPKPGSLDELPEPFILASTWSQPALWRHLVPEPEDLELAEEDADDAEA